MRSRNKAPTFCNTTIKTTVAILSKALGYSPSTDSKNMLSWYLYNKGSVVAVVHNSKWRMSSSDVFDFRILGKSQDETERFKTHLIKLIRKS